MHALVTFTRRLDGARRPRVPTCGCRSSWRSRGRTRWGEAVAPLLAARELSALSSSSRSSPGRYPAFDLALAAGRAGGTAPCVLNAADEVAVECSSTAASRSAQVPRGARARARGASRCSRSNRSSSCASWTRGRAPKRAPGGALVIARCLRGACMIARATARPSRGSRRLTLAVPRSPACRWWCGATSCWTSTGAARRGASRAKRRCWCWSSSSARCRAAARRTRRSISPRSARASPRSAGWVATPPAANCAAQLKRAGIDTPDC